MTLPNLCLTMPHRPTYASPPNLCLTMPPPNLCLTPASPWPLCRRVDVCALPDTAQVYEDANRGRLIETLNVGAPLLVEVIKVPSVCCTVCCPCMLSGMVYVNAAATSTCVLQVAWSRYRFGAYTLNCTCLVATYHDTQPYI